ncbi:8-oxoguanine deaminase [Alicyclobacillus cellulosilyticus]|uniref:8-oxoguanine deaminase n=1 Tax=Alicyclobacillus cellulosilyticus TaxID=1003997 RepID=A0A917KG02_9BACL|nr:8-oxoguanine deaminase [Alicyclobacillus cellulosilyticus]GGJ10706.1 8-oxoguanine deaminase [Alicyclobacillus cellulosilyticus]
MGTLLIRNARNIITMDDQKTKIPGGSIFVQDQKIVAIGTSLPYDTADVVIDARDKIVYPGLVNTHHHLYQSLTRNIPLAQSCSLFDWLTTLYEIWVHLRPEDVYLSAMIGLGELLKSGCTTSSDHFYCFPNATSPYLIDEEIRAARDVGIRFFPTRGAMSLGRARGGLPPDELCQDENSILKDMQRVIERYHDARPFAMVRVGVAPCSPFSVTKDLMLESARLARAYGVRMHTHLAETLDEESFCLQTMGVRPLDFMEMTEWTGSDVWYAHGIWFSDAEIQRLARHGCGIAHCPTSNMKLASGVFPLAKMKQSGIPIGLGVDGSASNDTSNMLLEVRMAHLLHRLHTGPDALSAEDALYLATRGSAQILGWDDEIGSLEVGKAADMFLIDTRRLEYAGALFDDAALPVLTGLSQIVDTTIVGGRVVVEHGRLVHVDEEQLAQVAQRAATRLVEEASLRTGIDYRQSRTSPPAASNAPAYQP